MASLAGGLPDRRHHPLPAAANGHALRAGTPHFLRKSAIALARLHCLRRTQRSLRRSQSSRSRSALLQAAWRKYVTQPVVKLFTSAIIRSNAYDCQDLTRENYRDVSNSWEEEVNDPSLQADELTKSLFPEFKKSGRQSNPNRVGAGNADEAIHMAAKMATEQLRRMYQARPSEALQKRRAAEKLATAALARALGAEKIVAEASNLNALRRAELHAVFQRNDIQYRPRHQLCDPANFDTGLLWWAETNWWTGNRVGLYGHWDDNAGRVRLVGEVECYTGDLLKDNTGFTALFGLGSDGMPPAGRYTSSPDGDLLGVVMGTTGSRGVFDFSDYWSKCWLHLDQTVRSANGDVIANGHSVQQLIFMESSGEDNIVPLPGSIFFPPSCLRCGSQPADFDFVASRLRFAA
jgi:hypothetical protein